MQKKKKKRAEKEESRKNWNTFFTPHAYTVLFLQAITATQNPKQHWIRQPLITTATTPSKEDMTQPPRATTLLMPAKGEKTRSFPHVDPSPQVAVDITVNVERKKRTRCTQSNGSHCSNSSMRESHVPHFTHNIHASPLF
jgi:hypothetical protein